MPGLFGGVLRGWSEWLLRVVWGLVFALLIQQTLWLTRACRSITKLIGESFKLHSQSLVGYDDSMMAPDGEGSVSSPLDSRPMEALEMQTAY